MGSSIDSSVWNRSREFACSKALVIRCIRATAFSKFIVQESLLKVFIKSYAMRPPRGSTVAQMWDEAMHKLMMKINKLNVTAG